MTGPAHDAVVLDQALEAMGRAVVPVSARGFGEHAGMPWANVVALGLRAEDLLSPIAVLREDHLRHNARRMAEYCSAAGVMLAPHVKTTMSPQVVRLQWEAGAWAVTVANVTQARTMIWLGARRVLIANEVLDPREVGLVGRLLRRHADLEVFCFADSIASVRSLAAGIAPYADGQVLGVLVEVGHPSGRAGVRDLAAARATAAEVAASAGLELRGVGGFEGALAGDRSSASMMLVDDYLDELVTIARDLADQAPGIGEDRPWIVTAGGSVYFDLVAARTGATGLPEHVVFVLRSGAYIAHDWGYLSEVSPLGPAEGFRSALAVHARVVSRPSNDLVILDAGKRDVGTDLAMPAVTARRADGRWVPMPVSRLAAVNDQHAYLRTTPGVPSPVPLLPPGSVVALTAAHPCTTFDRWQHLAVVDERDMVVDIAHTFF